MNSNNPASNPETSPLTSPQSVTAPLASMAVNEAPLLSLPPGASLLAPDKPLVEMSDAELQAWHGKLRDHKNFQTMQAHLNAVATKVVGTKTTAKSKVDVSEFI